MHCPNVHQLAEYLEGLGSPRLRQRLSNHLDGCARCQQEMGALQRTAQLLQDLPTPCVPDNLWAGVAARISSAPRRTMVPWLWRTAAGVGLTASLLVGILVTNRPQPSLPYATAATASYVSQHQLLSARDPLSDRASLGVQLAVEQGSQ
ncbi:MAG TPA: zf-HC2 domain-containing protein [Armatimonadota bacterium]|jgi:anti-sigma factor RsiW